MACGRPWGMLEGKDEGPLPGGARRDDALVSTNPTAGRRPGETMIPDATLHRRLLTRDVSVLGEIYGDLGAPAYGLALKITGQPSLAQDAVQDAFLALWELPQAYDPSRGTFRTFLLSMVHHRAVDIVRREQRQSARVARVQHLAETVSADVAEEVTDASWATQRRAQVRRALAALPDHQRQVLELAYFRGYTQLRIAEEIGVPLGTVKTRTLAAMRRLRSELAADAPEAREETG